MIRQRTALETYLYNQRMSVTEFSLLLDYSRTHLSQVIHGRQKPSRKLARAIERTTNGNITAEELLKVNREE